MYMKRGIRTSLPHSRLDSTRYPPTMTVTVSNNNLGHGIKDVRIRDGNQTSRNKSFYRVENVHSASTSIPHKKSPLEHRSVRNNTHGIPTSEGAHLDSWWFEWVLWGEEKNAMILPACEGRIWGAALCVKWERLKSEVSGRLWHDETGPVRLGSSLHINNQISRLRR